MTVIEQRAGDDPDRVGEVDDPRVRRSAAPHFVGDVEHDRHRAQSLGEASGTGGLLADAAASQRNGLVEVPCRLTADAQLQKHEVGAVDRLGKIGSSGQLPVPSMTAGDPLAHTGDSLETGRVGVAQHELVDLDLVAQPGDAVDELGRVGASTTDHGDLHAADPCALTLPATCRAVRGLRLGLRRVTDLTTHADQKGDCDGS